MVDTVALILAGGRGVRAGGGIPKQYREIAGTPLLRLTLEAFCRHPEIDAVGAVIHPDDTGLYEAASAGLSLLPPVFGGATRQDSGHNGLKGLAGRNPDNVLIHDAARPFISAEAISRVVAALGENSAVLAAVRVTDTIKREAADGSVGETVDRNGLWRAQTPQGFRFADILAAHEAAQRDGAGGDLTDDAAVAEAAGHTVHFVEGNEENFKVTTADDFARAERHIAPAGAATGADFRVGSGFDVHRFGPGDAVILCGVEIPHDQKLAGHSDADVGLHAITDAILGGISAGDIGAFFPPSDPQWQGADSAIFLAKAGELVREKGGSIAQIDVTLICEAPKIGPHRAAMQSRIAEILEIDAGRVSVKATTTERLGFTGRGEGIAAQATATIRL
jgi:2-C-methyl-D-erythritol 4-phosphate cytidylyltransferase/2-C-methyl-D-erythritol 2,4-cyclodiphosphate synthase